MSRHKCGISPSLLLLSRSINCHSTAALYELDSSTLSVTVYVTVVKNLFSRRYVYRVLDIRSRDDFKTARVPRIAQQKWNFLVMF